MTSTTELLSTARGLVASFDPASGPERAAAFLTDLTNLFTEGTAEHAVTVALNAPNPDHPIDVLGFSARVRNALMRGGYRTVRDLTSCDRDDLYDLRNFGPAAMDEVTARLAERGLKLRNVFAPAAQSVPIGFDQYATTFEHIAEAHDQYRAGEMTAEGLADVVHEQVGDMPVRLGGAS